jgi:hypothetical protein
VELPAPRLPSRQGMVIDDILARPDPTRYQYPGQWSPPDYVTAWSVQDPTPPPAYDPAPGVMEGPGPAYQPYLWEMPQMATPPQPPPPPEPPPEPPPSPQPSYEDGLMTQELFMQAMRAAGIQFPSLPMPPGPTTGSLDELVQQMVGMMQAAPEEVRPEPCGWFTAHPLTFL